MESRDRRLQSGWEKRTLTGAPATRQAGLRLFCYRTPREAFGPTNGVCVTDEISMARAVALARSVPFTGPNPRVGCVIVRDGKIVGQGAHAGAGHPHAEAVALEGVDATGATAFVTLEPCTHHGRTPPCAPLLIEAGVARVVIAMEDPDPRVAGRGVSALEAAGIEVTVGVLRDEVATMIAPYLHHRLTGRSFLTLKMATSLDGAMAAADGSSRWITSEATRKRVHERRAEVDAVMVGVGTVLADDPQLTVRHVPAERQPVRIIVDAQGRTPVGAKVLAVPGETIVAVGTSCSSERQIELKQAGAEVIVLPPGPGGRGVDVGTLMAMLGERGMLEVYCEGGPTLATGLLRANVVDRLELHLGPMLLGEGARLGDLGVGSIAQAPRWEVRSVERIGSDAILICGRA